MGYREWTLIINNTRNSHGRYGILILIALCWLSPVSAETLPYAGMTLGPAKTSQNDQFDASDTAYLFLGIQTEYYATYEIGVTRLKRDTLTQTNNQKTTLTLVDLSGLAHLPISDSSLFVRVGISAYEYYDDKDELQRVVIPTYGAGFDLGVIPRLSIRLEWQRYLDLEMNQVQFDIETIRLGAFYYF